MIVYRFIRDYNNFNSINNIIFKYKYFYLIVYWLNIIIIILEIKKSKKEIYKYLYFAICKIINEIFKNS